MMRRRARLTTSIALGEAGGNSARAKLKIYYTALEQ